MRLSPRIRTGSLHSSPGAYVNGRDTVRLGMSPPRTAKTVARPVQPASKRKRRSAAAERRAAVAACVVGYLRVSTSEQAESGLGLEAQRAAIEAACMAKGWTVAAWCVDEGVSGSVTPASRPAMAEALEFLDTCGAGALVVAKLDRCSRDSHDFTGLLKRATRDGWAFVALDLGVDTSTPVGRMVAEMMVAVAQWERAVIRQRTKDAMAAKKAKGARLGRPTALSASVLNRVIEEREAGRSLRAIAARLNADGVPNPTGSVSGWSAPTVARAEQTARLDAEAAKRKPWRQDHRSNS